MNIEEYIPFGVKNAVSREQLCIRTGLSDRKVRELIEKSDALIVYRKPRDSRVVP